MLAAIGRHRLAALRCFLLRTHSQAPLVVPCVRSPTSNGKRHEQVETSVISQCCAAAWKTEMVWQATNCSRISEVGSYPPILGKITTSPAICATKGQRRGSFRAIHFRNGNHPGQVLFFGSMGNVCRCPVLTPLRMLMVCISRSGSREECALVR